MSIADRPEVSSIVNAASITFNVGPRDIRSRYMAYHLAHTRHAICLVAKENGWPLRKIGPAICRDYTTVRDSIKRAKALTKTDPAFAARVDRLRTAILLEQAA